MAQWAYKVAYIDYRGRVSSEGLETLIGSNERRSVENSMKSFRNVHKNEGVCQEV